MGIAKIAVTEKIHIFWIPHHSNAIIILMRSIFPMVPGHEIVGIVTKVGANVSRYKLGDRVGVGCLVDSCRKCNPCITGLDQYCIEGPTMTYNGIERDGQT